MPTSRFNLTTIAGNQIVDWAVIEANYATLGNNAAHLTLGNTLTGTQTINGSLGLTGVHRRITLPIPPASATDRIHIQADTAGTNGTFLGLAGPPSAGAGQRKATLAIHGVEPTTTTAPAGLTFLLDEDNKRASVQATGTYQDLSTVTLQLGAGGTDRITMAATGAINVIGAMTATGAFQSAGLTTTTLTATGVAAFQSTSTFTGAATFNGGISSAATLTINAPMNVTGLATFSGGISGGIASLSGGNTLITGTLGVTGATTLQSTLAVTGATTLSGVLQFAGGASYIQALSGDTSFVQVSKLNVQPGTATLTSLTVTGTSTHTGATTQTGLLTATAGVTVPNNVAYNARDVDGTSRAILFRDNSNQTVLQAGSNNVIRFVNSTAATQYGYFDAAGTLNLAGALTAGGGVNAAGSVSAGSQVFTTPSGSLYLRGADGNVHIDQGGGILYVTGYLSGRVAAGYDPGAGWSVAGAKIISQEFVYQRANGAVRCWDNVDFTYGTTWNSANTLVQRDSAGTIHTNAVYVPTAIQAGKPTYVWGDNGDGYSRRWPVTSVGPPAGLVVLQQGWTVSVNQPPMGEQVSAFGVDRNGYWVIVMRGQVNSGNNYGNVYYRFDIDGIAGSADSGRADAGGDETLTATVGLKYGPVFLTPGNIIRTYANRDEATFTGTTYAFFMPVAAYNGV